MALRDVVEVGVPGDGLAAERGEEQQQKDDGHAVFSQEAAHAQLWISPMAE